MNWVMTSDAHICSWDDFEKLMHAGFYNMLRVAPEDHVPLVIEPGGSGYNKHTRQKLLEVLF